MGIELGTLRSYRNRKIKLSSGSNHGCQVGETLSPTRRIKWIAIPPEPEMLESMKARKRVRAVPPMRRKMAHEIKLLKTDIPDVLGQRPDIDDLDWSECRDMGYKTIDP